MRAKRQRVFKITVNGRDQWKEEAGNRSVVETQHKLATEMFPGSFVRIQEIYIGGARPSRVLDEEEEV